jgi:hypothetical protein
MGILLKERFYKNRSKAAMRIGIGICGKAAVVRESERREAQATGG